jgi:DNA-binding MarR family transcriptional regulator
LTESLPSLTQKTQKLEELNYLKKEKDKEDPRKNNLRIMEKGEKALSRVEKKIELVSSAVFLKYSQKEKEKFLEILEYLEGKLKKKIN